MKLALHACCGPCLLEPYDALSREVEQIAVIYANPNIQPADEYARRRDTIAAHTTAFGMAWVELPYDAAGWSDAVASVVHDRVQRCRACYRLRIGSVAQWAADNGFDAVATTLTVSPYQDPAAITEEGAAAAAAAGVRYLERDFRALYEQATRRSKELGMYRQSYCGCLPSLAEAQEERAARKAERAARAAGG